MLPLCWDNMTTGENLEMFALPPLSPEYQSVEKAFRQTAKQTVLKVGGKLSVSRCLYPEATLVAGFTFIPSQIERVQNVYLRWAYDVQKKCIADKNSPQGGAGEKLLYHGTTYSNSKLIVKNGFNRQFSGKNGMFL